MYWFAVMTHLENYCSLSHLAPLSCLCIALHDKEELATFCCQLMHCMHQILIAHVQDMFNPDMMTEGHVLHWGYIA